MDYLTGNPQICQHPDVETSVKFTRVHDKGQLTGYRVGITCVCSICRKEFKILNTPQAPEIKKGESTQHLGAVTDVQGLQLTAVIHPYDDCVPEVVSNGGLEFRVWRKK